MNIYGIWPGMEKYDALEALTSLGAVIEVERDFADQFREFAVCHPGTDEFGNRLWRCNLLVEASSGLVKQVSGDALTQNNKLIAAVGDPVGGVIHRLGLKEASLKGRDYIAQRVSDQIDLVVMCDNGIIGSLILGRNIYRC